MVFTCSQEEKLNNSSKGNELLMHIFTTFGISLKRRISLNLKGNSTSLE